MEGVVRLKFNGFYQGKRVLVTGHTGFKGGWLALWLKQLGADVLGLALPPEPLPNLHEIIHPGTFTREFMVDDREAAALCRAVAEAAPDFIFHLATQPLVRRSYAEPVETVATDVLGTIHLLEAVRRFAARADVLVITSYKCYKNRGGSRAYRETIPWGGHDVYSASKAACEILAGALRRVRHAGGTNPPELADTDRAPESLSENCVGSCGEGFWRWPRRRGRSIPAAGCNGRANTGHGQKTRRPTEFSDRL